MRFKRTVETAKKDFEDFLRPHIKTKAVEIPIDYTNRPRTAFVWLPEEDADGRGEEGGTQDPS